MTWLVIVVALVVALGIPVAMLAAAVSSAPVEPGEPSGWDELDGVVSGRVMAGRVLLSDNETGEGS